MKRNLMYVYLMMFYELFLYNSLTILTVYLLY